MKPLNDILSVIFYNRSKDACYIHRKAMRISLQRKGVFLFIESIDINASLIPTRDIYFFSSCQESQWSLSISKEF